MAEKNETGKQGEVVARSFLEINGYKILDTNWHFRHYELDIVATNGRELVVVEVKTRSEKHLVEPEETVDGNKIRRIVAASDAYSQVKNIDLPIRFDIICLIKNSNSYAVERHIEDAFYAPMH